MSWQEVCPGTHRRAIGENEQFVKFVGDRAHPVGLEQWSITTWARFKPGDNRDARQWADTLREAWKHLRFQHPSIASLPAPNGDAFEYRVPDASQLTKWTNETFFIEEDPYVDVDTVIAGLKPEPSLTLHWLPARWLFLLHTPHWRMDGYSAFCLLDAFFDSIQYILDNRCCTDVLAWGEEASRLVPSVEAALHLPTEVTSEIDSAARTYIEAVKRVSGGAGLPHRVSPTKPPGHTAHVELRLSPNLTAALETTSKEYGFSVYSAVQAAVAAVNWKEASASSRDQYYPSTIRLNLREYVPATRKRPPMIPGLYSGGYTFNVSPNLSLIEHAREYEAERQYGVTEEFLNSRRYYAKLLLQGLQSGEKIQSASNIDSFFVSDVDQIIQSVRTTRHGTTLEVLDVGLGVSTLTPQPFCFYMKFRDQIHLQLWYNESYYDKDFAEEILESINEVLVSDLVLRS